MKSAHLKSLFGALTGAILAMALVSPAMAEIARDRDWDNHVRVVQAYHHPHPVFAHHHHPVVVAPAPVVYAPPVAIVAPPPPPPGISLILPINLR